MQVSTVGVVSKMRRLTLDLPNVSLALSLHAPNQEMRSKIVPTAKRYPIEDLIDALDNHLISHSRMRMPLRETSAKKNSDNYNDDGNDDNTRVLSEKSSGVSRRRAMIEYVMLEGDTSTFECAHQLGRLCEDRHIVVNLIPYNKTDADDTLSCPSEDHMQEFRKIVVSYGTFCTIRRTMGADIDSACGQLVTKTLKDDRDASATVDIEDVAVAPLSVGKKRGSGVTKIKRQKSGNDAELLDRGDDDTYEDLDKWVKPLSIATGVAAFCFVVTSSLYLRQQQRRR